MTLPISLSFGKIDVVIGVVLGSIFSLLVITGSNFVIGIPEVQSLGEIGRFGIIATGAPFGEEFLFKFGLLNILLLVGFGFVVSGLMTSIGFSLFHFLVYENNTGPLVGAFIFSMVTSYAAYKRGNVLVAIIPHLMFNVVLYLANLGVI